MDIRSEVVETVYTIFANTKEMDCLLYLLHKYDEQVPEEMFNKVCEALQVQEHKVVSYLQDKGFTSYEAYNAR